MSSEHQPLPLDPGPVPASLRDAFVLSQGATRAFSPLPLPDEAALALLADEDGDDAARSAVVEQLLASADGMLTLVHLVAARASTTGTHALLGDARPPARTTPLTLAGAPARRRTARSALKPILLAASLMLVSSTSWYVFTLPRRDDVRSLGSSVELQDVVQHTAAAPVTLTWKSLRTTARYRVEVLDVNDDPVFATETNDTITVVPRASLKPGPYRWWVRSRGTDGTEIRSRVEKITVR